MIKQFIIEDKMMNPQKTPSKNFPDENQYWVWIRPNTKATSEDLKREFARMRKAGIQHIAAELYNSSSALFRSSRVPVKAEWLEIALPAALAEGIQLHAWMWSMPCNLEKNQKEHPEWFAVNRKQQSVLTHPAYVPYYKFMCPSRPGVHQFVRDNVKELAQYQEIAGIHLDYIRYPDVILPETLQPEYNIVQDKEYPEYDYCYCELCRENFQKESGIDPLEIEDPANHEAWLEFRYHRIINLVNNILAPAARSYDKHITAAVFPNWYNVRQQWFKWNLDAFLPMLYHNFYHGDLNWLKEQTRIAVDRLPETTPLYSGLYIPAISPTELPKAIDAALEGGAKGVSLFDAGSMSEEHWQALESAQK